MRNDYKMLAKDFNKLLSKFPNGMQFVGKIPRGHFYLVDYKINHQMFSSGSGNITICNNTNNSLSIVAFDEFVTSNRKNPSGCDYLISRNDSSDFVILCELKDIRLDYLDKANCSAKNQLINSFDLLSSMDIIHNYSFVFGVMGVKLKNSNDNIQHSYKTFTQHSYSVPLKVKKMLKEHGFTDVFTDFRVRNNIPFVFALYHKI